MTPTTLLIRADASPRMGTGHVMRCLALGQAWQAEGGAVVFASAQYVAGLDARIRDEQMEIVHLSVLAGGPDDAAATVAAARACGAAWVVLDGYHFSGAYQRVLKEAGLRVMAVDDFVHTDHYWADLVLNQDVYAAARLYESREAGTELLLGTDYAFLRREFWSCPRPDIRVPETARRLLVTLGGADPTNSSLKIVEALRHPGAEDLESLIVIGPSNPYRAEVETAAAAQAGRIRVVCCPPDIPGLMQWCDLAISAGGSTMWELAYFRVPCMVLVLIENQLSTALVLERMGACRVLADALHKSPPALGEEIVRLAADAVARKSYAEKFGSLIDGRGAQRVCAALRARLPREPDDVSGTLRVPGAAHGVCRIPDAPRPER